MQLNKISELLNFKISLKLFNCGALVLLADFLFYSEKIGWTAGLFGFLMLMVAFIHNKNVAKNKLANIAFFLTLGLIFALVEKPTALAIIMYYISIILMVLLPKLTLVDDARAIAQIISHYILTGCLLLAYLGH